MLFGRHNHPFKVRVEVITDSHAEMIRQDDKTLIRFGRRRVSDDKFDVSAIEHERENRPNHLYRVKQADLHTALKRNVLLFLCS